MSDYTSMTVAELKTEITLRVNDLSSLPFNTKTRKQELIDWLTNDDEIQAILKEYMEPKPAKVTRPMTYYRKVGIYTNNGARQLTTAQKRQLRKTAKRQMKLTGVFDLDWSR